VAGAPDQVDLNLVVVEKPTGSLQLGAGFSTAESSRCRLDQAGNAFGTGNYLAWTSTPASTTRRWSSTRSTLFHARRRLAHDRSLPSLLQALRESGGNYELITSAAGLRFGVPFSELDTIYFGGSYERTQIVEAPTSGGLLAYAQMFGFTSNALPLSVGWSRDNRDSALAPTSVATRGGRRSGVISDARYFRGNYQFQQLCR